MSDRVLHSWYETSNGQTVDWRDRIVGSEHAPRTPFAYDDALKFTSGLTEFTGRFGTVYSGAENAADLNNKCRNVNLSADRWMANGSKYPFTIKGGSESIVITGVLDGHGTEVDVDAGNWSDQSNNWVKLWTLGLKSLDGKPIVVRCLQAHAPYFMDGTGPYVYAFPSPYSWCHGIAVWLLQLWWKVTK